MIDKKANKIHILPDFIANQIAAGEVVQRPESAVKELVENSLDAGATEIAVIVKGSGKQIIHIVDNGDGMNKDDLLLSVKRHATSKIFSTDDLEEIRTFGFRGEALASIASIANLEIMSRCKDDKHGWKLIAEPMKDVIIEPCSMDIGTQVFVRNLFFNVPARRKFLKSNITEFRYISDTMLKFSLCKPDIRFTFYDNNNLIFDAHPADEEQRIRDVLGNKVVNAIIPVLLQQDFIQIQGFIGEPLIAKQSKSGQYLFLNSRSIVSKSLSHAVFSAFEHLLEKRSHPFYILKLTIDPKNVDVNVHPQKHEVKFDDERYIYNLVNKAVDLALQKHNLTPEIYVESKQIQSPFIKTGDNYNDFKMVNTVTGEIIDTDITHKEPIIEKPYNSSNLSRQSGFDFKKTESFSQQKVPQESAYDAIFGKTEPEISNLETNDYKVQQAKPDFEILQAGYWQLHDKYLFMPIENGFVIIDQHAAHERILYERALKTMNKEFSNSQELLFPINLQLNSSQYLLATELKSDLSKLGFDFQISKESGITINGIPSDIKNGTESESLLQVLEQYEEYQKIRESSKRDNLAASYACKSAIKSGHSLTQDEIKRLIDDLFKCSMPYVCPHGRPTTIEFSMKELDKRFGRT